jgi:undecaprenyl diphosphate synthase
LWPDFNHASLLKAVDSYRERERRFGRTSEQLQATTTTNDATAA